MGRSNPGARVDSLRGQIERLAAEFAEAAGEALRVAISGAVERFVLDRAEWFAALDQDVQAAFRRTMRETIARSSAATAARLRDLDLWLAPTVRLEYPPGPDMDNPNHRVWIAMLNAADPLDSVLAEFGLQPSEIADAGGGHFGLQPQSAGELDPRGTLTRLWQRYVPLHQRYRQAAQHGPASRELRNRQEALRRWRDPD